MSSVSRHNPSFSSTVLDQIYRSIDQQSTTTFTSESTHTKFGGSKPCRFKDDHDHDDDQRRACLVQKWMENKVRQKPVVGRRSAVDQGYERESFCLNSSSSSSDSCCGVNLWETESVYGVKPKPIRTGVYRKHDEVTKQQRHEDSQRKCKDEGKFVKTKWKALKIYSELKQPISPGGRLGSFLNSLFTTGNNNKNNNKKPTTSTASDRDRKSKSANASTCSSSSLSRSCLISSSSSNTTSERLRNGMKRTVRFYPVSVVEDKEENSIKLAEVKNRERINILNKKYQQKKKSESECDDGGSSDSSSDLFELDNLSTINGIGMHKYEEELPVYETTQLKNNRPIAEANVLFSSRKS